MQEEGALKDEGERASGDDLRGQGAHHVEASLDDLGQARDDLVVLLICERDQIVFFNRLDEYHESSDSGERQCKSRT